MIASPFAFALLSACPAQDLLAPDLPVDGAQVRGSGQGPGQGAGAPALRYVVPEEGAPMRAPRVRALSLTPGAPADVAVEFQPVGKWTRFGQHRYGDPGTTRVAFALDRDANGDLQLYLDGNRDRRLCADELVPPTSAPREGSEARTWEAPLDLALRKPDGKETLTPRRVIFEMGESGTIFGAATVGYLEGTVTIGDRPVQTRRRDGDANGCFGEPADHLWLDRDGDGSWAPLRELYVTQPLMSFPGPDGMAARYALRSSRVGDDLRFDRIEGTGTAKMVIPGDGDSGPRDDITEAYALFVGRDGSSVRVDASASGTELPIGEYRMTSLSLRLQDPRGGQVWSYLFSSAFEPTEGDWVSIDKGAVWEFDPVGALGFSVDVPEPKEHLAGGDMILVDPRLYTGGKLLVRNVYRGWDASGSNHRNGAEVRLLADSRVPLVQATSGFL